MSKKAKSSRKKTTMLPDKPSALIRLALQDLEAVEKQKDYVVDMDTWHLVSSKLSYSKKCAVCFAGAVMARSLHVDHDVVAGPSDFPRATENKLLALDFFRRGRVIEGLAYMGIDNEQKIKWLPYYVEVTDYHKNKKTFKKDMVKLATILETEWL